MQSDEEVWLEAPDVTASEEHQALAVWLENAITATMPDPSAVIGATFLIAPDGQMVSADILVAEGSSPGKRPSWRLPRDPVPDVTIEIVSPSNETREGRRLVEEKRRLYGRIGVPEHLELDPNRGTIDVWVSRDGELMRVAHGLRTYLSTRLGGLTIAANDNDELVPYRPDGQRFPKPKEAMEALDAAQAAAAAAEARVERLQAQLRAAGIEPTNGG